MNELETICRNGQTLYVDYIVTEYKFSQQYPTVIRLEKIYRPTWNSVRYRTADEAKTAYRLELEERLKILDTLKDQSSFNID